MAKSQVVIEDSFAAILRDLGRVNQDAHDVVRSELATAVGGIVDNTPQTSGQAASGWVAGADKLGSRHKPIKQGKRLVRKASHYRAAIYRSAKKGVTLGDFAEVTTGKSGNRLRTVRFEAINHDKGALALEYGYGHVPRLRLVRKQIVEMKKRIGPHFAAAFRATVRKPKRKKKTVVKG